MLAIVLSRSMPHRARTGGRCSSAPGPVRSAVTSCSLAGFQLVQVAPDSDPQNVEALDGALPVESHLGVEDTIVDDDVQPGGSDARSGPLVLT